MSYLDAEATIARVRFLPGTDARKAKSTPSSAVLDEAPVGDRREAAAAFAESALEASTYIEGVVKVFLACTQRARGSMCERYFRDVRPSQRILGIVGK
jgi:hypothetical protein